MPPPSGAYLFARRYRDRTLPKSVLTPGADRRARRHAAQASLSRLRARIRLAGPVLPYCRSSPESVSVPVVMRLLAVACEAKASPLSGAHLATVTGEIVHVVGNHLAQLRTDGQAHG